MATLFDLAQAYLNRALPETFKYDRTPRIGIPTPVPTPVVPEPIKQLPRPGGNEEGFSVYNPDPNRTRTPDRYSPYNYRQAAERNLIGDFYSSGTEAQKLMDMYPDYYTGPQLTGIPGAISNYAKNSLAGQLIGNVMGGIENLLPVNRRAILENEALGAGIRLDDIGRVVSDGGNINTAENIMAGYNLAQITPETIQKRRDVINENMKDPEQKKAKLDALNEFEEKMFGETGIKTKADIVFDDKSLAKDPTYKSEAEKIIEGITAAEDDKGNDMLEGIETIIGTPITGGVDLNDYDGIYSVDKTVTGIKGPPSIISKPKSKPEPGISNPKKSGGGGGGGGGGSFVGGTGSAAAADTSQGETGYGSCFIAGTKITMADGAVKNIEDIKVGDIIKGHKGNNEVIKLDPTLLGERKLYSLNDNEHYFFTSEHPFMTEEGWKSIKPEKTKERDGIELYNQLKGELKIGDKLLTEKGLIEIKEIKSKEMNDPKMPLYNFNVSNDNSYIADGYVVHNKGGGGGGGGCFLKGTLVTMSDGSKKEIQEIDLGDEVAIGGKVFATGKFLVKNLHDYKGIKVSGSHMVSENNKWVRVEDSKHGKLLGNEEHTVYVFGSENRRILINDILFTDYFEVNEQDKLMNNEEDFFDNWKLYAKQDSGNNVDIINAS